MNSLLEMPISVIKVRIPPRRREVITRPRLIEQFYSHLDKMLVYVIAPAGYGKTSLLTDVAAQTDMPVCWLSLDSLDADPQRFLRYVIAALAERFPGFGTDSLAVLGSMTSLENDQEQIMVSITNEINNRIRDHFMLVLDDFHLVAEEQTIRHMLGRFLQLCGENVHLVISSRFLPDLPISPLLIARNQAGGLSFEDLSFRMEEIQSLFRQSRGMDLDRHVAESILKETEGWVAAIHLSDGDSRNFPDFQPLRSTTALFDFFSTEVMKRQTRETQRFLCMTSVFDAFDLDLCERVLAHLPHESVPDIKSLFQQLQSATNFFIMPLDKEGRWIRYHHLFQHYLFSQLQYEWPVLAWSLQKRLAQVYEEDRKFEEALQIYERLNDHQNQIGLLIKTSADFIRSGRILTLDTWLKKVPIDLAYTQPALLSIMGAVQTTQGNQRQALLLLNEAEQHQRGTQERLEWFKTLVRRAEVNRQLGLFAEALKDIDLVMSETKEREESGLLIIQAESRRVRGLALFGLGHANEALAWLEESLHQYQRLGQLDQIPILETELGVIHRRLGDMSAAAGYYTRALTALEQGGRTGWKARLLNNIGMLKYMTGQVEEAYGLLNESIKIAAFCGYVRIQTNALISLGDLLSDLENFDAAFNCYDQALTHAMQLGHSLHIFYASLGGVRLKRLRGDPQAALQDLRHVELSQVKLGSFEQAFFNLEQGLCRLESGRWNEAAQDFRSAARLFLEGGNQVEGTTALLWLAAAVFPVEPQTAISDLRDLLPPRREWSIPTPLMLHAGRMARLLRSGGHTRLIRNPDLRVFFEHAQRQLDNLPNLLKTGPWLNETGTGEKPRLVIKTFGQIQVYHHGKLLEISDWQTREARDLFVYFLHSPPSTKEQIAVDFWPDLPPARIKLRFKINLYRIRQALGQDAILFKDDRYAFNHSIDYQWDREHFENLLLQSRQITADEERSHIIENALDMLRAGYLKELQAAWIDTDRKRYQELLPQMLLDLAEIRLRLGDGQGCLELTAELLVDNPLMEAAHRLILQAYAALHDPAGLASRYRHYQETLEHELGMLPSSEMRDLYQKLLMTI